jgi:DNA-binding NtrC family response regulator
VIATTNRSLRALVEEGKFRADLYYRLNVVPLTIPPLRERREDVARLIGHFLRKHAAACADVWPSFSRELIDRLEALDWPGNVRELENLVRRALALHTGEHIGVEFLQETEAPSPAPGRRVTAAQQCEPVSSEPVPGTSLRDMERRLLETTLEAAGGNRTHAARMLGVCPRTMRNKIREYGLPPRRYA